MYSKTCVVALVALCGAARISAAMLLADDFNIAALDQSKWRVDLPTGNYFPFGPAATANARVVQQNGSVTITGRGYLITQQEFHSPISVSGDATFVSILGGAYHVPLAGGDRSEFLDIGMRTSAIPNVNFFREPTDGLQFRLVVTPTVSGVGANPTTLAITDRNAGVSLGGINSSALMLGQGDSVHFSVTDDGQQVTFTVAKIVNGVPSETIRDSYTALATSPGTYNYVDFFTREDANAGNPRTVTIDNVNINSIPEPAGLAWLCGLLFAISNRKWRMRD